MQITFLHISDLHFRPNWPEQIQLVCNKFFEDLEIQLKEYENPFLVFSGDLVWSGGESTFYEEFEKHFATKLEQLGFPKERRICTPGNHDVSQSILKPNLIVQKGTLAQLSNEEIRNCR
jgi:UDP-2,3-diacylglucosamine pyrophosphatase LpxH